jgi:hypothetical protein
MRRTTKKKTIATTAFLLFLMLIAFLVPHFLGNSVDACGRHKPPHHHPRPPPLGKYIHAQFVCDQTGLPIKGLVVKVVETGDMATTDSEGKVVFGSGYAPGTYTIEWDWWDGHYSVAITIDCTKKDWYLEPYPTRLKNPEIHKTFVVDIHGGYETEPIEGLEVTLVGYGTKKTDAKGYVEWVVDYFVKNYTLEWTWNSKPASEPVHFEEGQGVWEKTNHLEPKSGGGT